MPLNHAVGLGQSFSLGYGEKHVCIPVILDSLSVCQCQQLLEGYEQLICYAAACIRHPGVLESCGSEEPGVPPISNTSTYKHSHWRARLYQPNLKLCCCPDLGRASCRF